MDENVAANPNIGVIKEGGIPANLCWFPFALEALACYKVLYLVWEMRYWQNASRGGKHPETPYIGRQSSPN